MTIRKLVIWITFLAIFAMAARISIVPDTWWHLSAGRWMVENRALIQVEPFSYTRAGIPWQYPGLWFEIMIYWIFQTFGPGGLNVLTAIFVTATYAVLWRMLSGSVLLRAFLLILSATVSAVYWAARPYLVSFLLAAVFLWILNEHHEERSDRIWILPLLMILWTNSHGGFIIGFLIIGVFWIELAIRAITRKRNIESRDEIWHRLFKLTIIIAIMVCAVVINPEGINRWSLPFTTVGRNAERTLIAEWQSPDFHNSETQPFAISFLLLFGVLGFSGLRMSGLEFLLISVFGYLGFISGRNIPLFSLVLPMILIRHIKPINERIEKHLRLNVNFDRNVSPPKIIKILNVALLAIILLLVIFKISLIYPEATNWTYMEAAFPSDAVQFLKQNPPSGRLFNSYNWGGFLTWTLPDELVFIDGRADVYGDEIINQWLHVVSASEGWESILEQWQVSTVIIEPTWPVTNYLMETGWQLTFEGDSAVVFER